MGSRVATSGKLGEDERRRKEKEVTILIKVKS
jgi:hypothetical protein